MSPYLLCHPNQLTISFLHVNISHHFRYFIIINILFYYSETFSSRNIIKQEFEKKNKEFILILIS